MAPKIRKGSRMQDWYYNHISSFSCAVYITGTEFHEMTTEAMGLPGGDWGVQALTQTELIS